MRPKGSPKTPGSGRKPGSKNKVTQTVKEAFEAAFRDSQSDPKCPVNLNNFKHEHPKEFVAAVARLIPAEIQGALEHKVDLRMSEAAILAMFGIADARPAETGPDSRPAN